MTILQCLIDPYRSPGIDPHNIFSQILFLCIVLVKILQLRHDISCISNDEGRIFMFYNLHGLPKQKFLCVCLPT
jgi:hypothetical protein